MENQQFPSNCENSTCQLGENDVERTLDEQIDVIYNSIDDLMRKYIMYSKSSESKVVSGGLQQFLIRKMRSKSKRKEEYHFSDAYYSKMGGTNFCNPGLNLNEDNKTTFSHFSSMPIGIKLRILSYLPCYDLANICSVCHEWNYLASDDVLWHNRLNWDVPKWETFSFTTNPQIYQDVNSEWAFKDIYYKCSPECNRSWKKLNSTFYQVSNMIKYFLPRKTPRVALFGPGLESSTHKIVSKLLYEDNNKFSRIAMFPGQFDGIGAGMTLKLKTGSTFHLTVLYSGTKKERENRNKNSTSRIFQNKIEGSGKTEIELQPAVKNLCHILDAFIFVVDASQTEDQVKNGLVELNAMINERWSAPHVPVIILSCTSHSTISRIPAYKIAQLFQLTHIDRKWLVQDCVVDNLEGIHIAMEWMIEHAQNK
ncbi:hypothetical protein LOTGIDRAFT_232302 [Lottia gigantea]|uniref:F-box domain-containing protein n=1 Tax=Lottia gigantea TaxID=225164 RepID=V4ALJ8_LOTGI|nr:hypothetical protein LOTGIDRAFT_232302 [Lottia gigantea]ESO94461.1 hypothetical protein LOTGIDRAFT_232302 [Lottia gigantea]